MNQSFKSRFTPKALCPEPKLSVSVDGYVSACYDLDKDRVELILQSGAVDVNSVHCFEQTNQRNGHMVQIFQCAKNSGVMCQIFEKIDQEEKANNIYVLLQVAYSLKLKQGA